MSSIIELSNIVKTTHYLYAEIKDDFSIRKILKALTFFERMMLFFSLIIFVIAIDMLSDGIQYYFSALAIGLTVYTWALVRSRNRLTTVNLSETEQNILKPLSYGISYNLLNSICLKFDEQGITLDQIDEITLFLDRNPFKEPFLYVLPNIMASFFGLTVTITALISGVYKFSDEQNDIVLAGLVLFLIVFLTTSIFFKMIQPVSINKRAIRLLGLLKIGACKKDRKKRLQFAF